MGIGRVKLGNVCCGKVVRDNTWTPAVPAADSFLTMKQTGPTLRLPFLVSLTPLHSTPLHRPCCCYNNYYSLEPYFVGQSPAVVNPHSPFSTLFIVAQNFMHSRSLKF